MKIAIIHYSMYGHVATMSESIKKGVLAADPSIQCDIYQVPETLPDDVLAKMYAPPKGDYPVITKDKLPEYDGFLFGISGRYGMMSAQMRVRMCVYYP
jgi:NAD(P)H dehydrogenase (quinone)